MIITTASSTVYSPFFLGTKRR